MNEDYFAKSGSTNNGNRFSETANIEIKVPLDVDTSGWRNSDGLSHHLGGNSGIGDGEWRELTGGFLNFGRGANDIKDVLDEMFFGDGIKGVALTTPTSGSIQLAITNWAATDFINLSGLYIEQYIADAVAKAQANAAPLAPDMPD